MGRGSCYAKRFACFVVTVVFIFHLVGLLLFMGRPYLHLPVLHHHLAPQSTSYVTSPSKSSSTSPSKPAPTSSSTPDLRPFTTLLGGDEKAVLLELLDVFTRTLTQAGIPFFMYGGTLIGSYRHHGQIPWDDDADVAVDAALRLNASQLLLRLKPDFVLDERQKVRWKLYAKNSKTIKGMAWMFPFLDINFYYQNATQVWDYDGSHFKKFIYPVDKVFPLLTRPFEGRHLPCPRDSHYVIHNNYDISVCQTSVWNHRLEKGAGSPKTVNCTYLYPLFPFVERVAGVSGGCNETLVVNRTVISWILMANDSC